MDVHKEATDFLSGLLKQRQADRAIISREQAPKFLAGFKADGRVVWTHDVRLARKFDQGSTELGGLSACCAGWRKLKSWLQRRRGRLARKIHLIA
jgi:hypothetical protein